MGGRRANECRGWVRVGWNGGTDCQRWMQMGGRGGMMGPMALREAPEGGAGGLTTCARKIRHCG
jgi:hypothetical protein